MKTTAWIVGVIGLLGLSWLGLFLVGTDVVESNYASLQEAHADQLFERGWLPDILPPSAHDIHTSNNLDLNTSVGRFYFDSADFGRFVSQLAPYVSMKAPFEGFERQVEQKRARGFSPGVFFDGNSVWVFMCKERDGYCEYDMWLNNG